VLGTAMVNVVASAGSFHSNRHNTSANTSAVTARADADEKDKPLRQQVLNSWSNDMLLSHFVILI
jgi:hypothetical protein